MFAQGGLFGLIVMCIGPCSEWLFCSVSLLEPKVLWVMSIRTVAWMVVFGAIETVAWLVAWAAAVAVRAARAVFVMCILDLLELSG
jgi:hypothetical protein